jgi:hypothetical protein
MTNIVNNLIELNDYDDDVKLIVRIYKALGADVIDRDKYNSDMTKLAEFIDKKSHYEALKADNEKLKADNKILKKIIESQKLINKQL